MVRKTEEASLQVKGIEVSNLSPLEVDDEEAEEAVEALLNELDHWEKVEEGVKDPLSGN